MKNKIYILHATNGRPYFEAVEYYAKNNKISLEYVETNWLKTLIKIILRKKCPTCNIKNVIKNFIFFMKVPFLKNNTIIYGTAPYDFRFIWYSILKNKNNFIYHTTYLWRIF